MTRDRVWCPVSSDHKTSQHIKTATVPRATVVVANQVVAVLRITVVVSARAVTAHPEAPESSQSSSFAVVGISLAVTVGTEPHRRDSSSESSHV
ncbi:hypothetical protein YC2023_030300 [Brassica napus]